MAIHDVECCDFYQIHDDVVKAVKEKMPDDDDLYDLAEIFKVFGDSAMFHVKQRKRTAGFADSPPALWEMNKGMGLPRTRI